ncbi:armadillo-type protein, partial [Amylostereum chailletii]
PNYIQELHNLLAQSAANDTVQLDKLAATARLDGEFYKHPACITAFANIIASSPEIAVRQLAGVEMLKRVSQDGDDLWTQVPEADREQIKADLPKLVLNESNELVRHTTARVIAAIADIEVPMQTWDQLIPFLEEICVSPQASHREAGLYMLVTLLGDVGEGFQSRLPRLLQLFDNLLRDPESNALRVAADRALDTIVENIDADDKSEIVSFELLPPGMIQVGQQTLDLGDEANAKSLLGIFQNLLIRKHRLLAPHIPQFTDLFVQCGANRGYDDELRVIALDALAWTVQYGTSEIQVNNLAGTILEGLMPITTEPEPEDADHAIDAPSFWTLRIIGALSTELPPSQVFPPLLTILQEYFASPDGDHRRGAMLAFDMSVEGCNEFMAPLMSQVWPIIDAGLQDPDAGVRKASCVAVNDLCQVLGDECRAHHAVLVPAIVTLVSDPATQHSASTALDGLIEILHDSIDQHLQLIMEHLPGLLETAPLPVKTAVTGAIGSAAHASKEHFLPYFAPTMERLKHFLVLTGEGEEQDLRGITMDAVGTFAEAVGKEVFRPYYADLMQQAFRDIETDSARFGGRAVLFFGVMARVFGEEFGPSLSAFVPDLVNGCKLEESVEASTVCFAVSDADVAAAFASGSCPSNAIAADAIGALFAATGADFLQSVEPCTVEQVPLLPHYYEAPGAWESVLGLGRA